jgi:hypothetical protein
VTDHRGRGGEDRGDRNQEERRIPALECDPHQTGSYDTQEEQQLSPATKLDRLEHTGGAKLSANGSAPLDAYTLTATNMINSATAIFLQGDATLATAAVFGDGLRCVAGSLKRIGVKTAVLGTTSYPGVGDPTVATRSATLGDTIPAGGTRYYLAYYRDSSASFCTSSTFNSTNGLQINY